jgi:hypothetical protein
MREKRNISEAPLTQKKAKTDKYARFRQLANEDPAAMSEALVELSKAFSSLAEASEALVENLDLAPIPVEASVKEKIASRTRFASALKRTANENPEAVEAAVNEIYNAVDEVAAALENLAGNLGFELSETEEEVPGEEMDLVVDPEHGEDLAFQNEDGSESVDVPISFEPKAARRR